MLQNQESDELKTLRLKLVVMSETLVESLNNKGDQGQDEHNHYIDSDDDEDDDSDYINRISGREMSGTNIMESTDIDAEAGNDDDDSENVDLSSTTKLELLITESKLAEIVTFEKIEEINAASTPPSISAIGSTSLPPNVEIAIKTLHVQILALQVCNYVLI